MFDRLQRETGIGGMTSHGLAIVPASHRMCGIFDDRDTGFGSDRADPIHIANHTGIMYDHDGFRFQRYLFSNAIRGNQPGCRIDVGPYHVGPDQLDRHIGGFCGQRRADDFVTWPHSGQHQCNM